MRFLQSWSKKRGSYLQKALALQLLNTGNLELFQTFWYLTDSRFYRPGISRKGISQQLTNKIFKRWIKLQKSQGIRALLALLVANIFMKASLEKFGSNTKVCSH